MKDYTELCSILNRKPKSKQDLLTNFMPSKLWRMNNLYTVIDKTGNPIILKMNAAQHTVYKATMKHKRLIILKSRQQGISTFFLIYFFDEIMFRPYLNVGLMAQGQSEAELLLYRVKLLWDKLDPNIKQYLNINITKNNTTQSLFSNESKILIKTSFRSATLQGLHISELGKIANNSPSKAEETKTGTMQAIAAGLPIIIESTAEGDNMFRDEWDKAMLHKTYGDKDFMPIFLSWLDDPDCQSTKTEFITKESQVYFDRLEKELNIKLTDLQKNFWIMQYRELGVRIYQEYPATPIEAFFKESKNTYYAELFYHHIANKGRIKAGLYEPRLPVQVSVDLGRNDWFVLCYFQTFEDGWRIIDEYYNNDYGIDHYCEQMDIFRAKYECTIDNIILPHDANVRDLTSNITREECFWKYGYDNTQVLTKTTSVNNDREEVREAMKNMYIDPKAEYIIKCFLNYSHEFDAKNNINKELENKDKYRHGADAIRYMVLGGDTYSVTERGKSSQLSFEV